ncbi:MAG: Gfo/Idh/MocA family oxidoreductase [candidate division NC10 bacterium]|nr:Gfo/Idh/MocA family oxidoreductase [candidate division NC10 bacterium]MBI2455584.1 Gfo/Idh/MocA family oxidoreductase [candidate division NC10 bacterium]
MAQGPLRVALLGCGFASEFHLKAWRLVPGAEVVALCDPDPAKLEARAREFGISRTFESVAALIQNIEVDAYDVATPHATHRTVTEGLVTTGNPVLCQKPLAGTLEDARAIVDLYTRSNVRFMVNENWRWRVWYQEIKRRIGAGEIGEPFYARLGTRGPAVVPTPEYPDTFGLPRFPRFTTMPQLLIIEFLVHHIDTMRFLFGEVDSLYAQTRNPTKAVAGESVATLVLNQGPLLGLLDSSWASYGYPAGTANDTFVVEGTRGSLFLSAEGRLTLHRADGRMDRIPLDTTDNYVRMYWGAINHFAECLRTGAPFQTDGPDNLKTLEAAFRAYDSARENTVIRGRT